MGYSIVLTPSGRLLRRSAHAKDRPAVYAAHFALSHACWLITYPLVGWLIAVAGRTTTFAVLALLAATGLAGGVFLWTQDDAGRIEHTYNGLSEGHPHIQLGRSHSHPIIIDNHHSHWPRV